MMQRHFLLRKRSPRPDRKKYKKRRNFSNFERLTPSGASELSCESSGVEARIAAFQKVF
jgi:hypothetical protein